MALTKCSECGNEVSDQANSCPKCGAPIKRDRYEVHTNMTMKEESQRMKEQDPSFCTMVSVVGVMAVLCAVMGFVYAGIFLIIAGVTCLILGLVCRSKGYPKNGNVLVILSIVFVMIFIIEVVIIAKTML
ncbi:MAG: zinc ribbon domain-containing protein [Porcipelethomonas sp.]